MEKGGRRLVLLPPRPLSEVTDEADVEVWGDDNVAVDVGVEADEVTGGGVEAGTVVLD